MSTVKLHYKNIAADAATYIGEPGSIFFDPTTSQLRVGDGVTPGGHAVTLDIGLATHDDAVEIITDLASALGTGFATNTDSLKQISARLTTVTSGTTLTAVQSTITTAITNATTALATAANLATAQNSLNTITTNVSTMASGTSLIAVQSTITTAVSSSATLVTGAGFTPGTDDLHAIRQAITAMQADITAIKNKVGA
jgi:hypothetical protein